MTKLEKKNISQPDSSNQIDHMKVESFFVGDMKINRHTADVGWKWSQHLKPIVGKDSCPTQHKIYILSGKMAVKMDDSTEMEFGPGDLGVIPPGHDGWNASDEPLVWLEFLHV